jgi:hypothetical protein
LLESLGNLAAGNLGIPDACNPGQVLAIQFTPGIFSFHSRVIQAFDGRRFAGGKVAIKYDMPASRPSPFEG